MAPSARAPAPKEAGEEEDEEEGEITADDSSGGGGGKKAAAAAEEEEVEERWTPVPDTFSSAAQYVDVWFPLLLQEMRAETLSEVTTEGLGAFSKVGMYVCTWCGLLWHGPFVVACPLIARHHDTHGR